MDCVEWMNRNSYHRIRIRKQNGRTEILPMRIETKELAIEFAEEMNQSQFAIDSGYHYEYAGSKLY